MYLFLKKVLKDIEKKNRKKVNEKKDIVKNDLNYLTKFKKDNYESVIIKHLWKEIRTLMWDYVGIVRTNERLLKAKIRTSIYKKEIEDFFESKTISSDIIELRNLIYIAEIIIISALSRKESRGLHYNLNFPNSDKVPKDTIININKKNKLKLYQEK